MQNKIITASQSVGSAFFGKNTAVWAGGGINMTHSRALVTNCVIVGCYSARGNGPYYKKTDNWYTDDRRIGGGVRPPLVGSGEGTASASTIGKSIM